MQMYICDIRALSTQDHFLFKLGHKNQSAARLHVHVFVNRQQYVLLNERVHMHSGW